MAPKPADALVDAKPIVARIAAEPDMIHVRRVLREAAVEAGLGLVSQTKFVTAGSELARNILNHATGSRGTVRVEQVRAGTRHGVRATFLDEGPGIEDVDLALGDGYSTGAGLGLGLPGAKRLVDELEIVSAPGTGTTVTILMWQR